MRIMMDTSSLVLFVSYFFFLFLNLASLFHEKAWDTLNEYYKIIYEKSPVSWVIDLVYCSNFRSMYLNARKWTDRD